MDLSDAPDEAQFRRDLRAWLEKSLLELPWPEPADLVEKAPFWRQWQAMLCEAGYTGLTWPREYGGQGLDERMRVIFGEECDLAGAPERLNIIGEDFAGPTIAHFGTDRQKDRYLRPILTGEEIWCQLFSEPGSGPMRSCSRARAVGPATRASPTSCCRWAARASRSGRLPTCSARRSSTRSSSTMCSCPTMPSSARSTGAGPLLWAPSPSNGSPSRPAG